MLNLRTLPGALLAAARIRVERLLHRFRMPVWYSPSYRLPMASAGIERQLEPRRADYVTWYLLQRVRVDPRWFRRPRRASYAALARVHHQPLLESITTAEGLARVFSVDPAEVPVEETLQMVRLACGATMAAAHEALAESRATCNLLGGFHHAAPDRAAAFCPVNDIAVAVAALRDQGFRGRVVILDLDAHPPDGTAACFQDDDSVWIGSLSGVVWGPLPRVDETVLPPGCGDDAYVIALEALLARMPRPGLAFVIAGGDVLRGDRLGGLGLSLEGARRRDLLVAGALAGKPSVWLPGGGYHDDAWRVLAGTTLAVGLGSERPIPPGYDPLDAHFASIAARLGLEQLQGGDALDLADVEADLFGRSTPLQRPRLLGLWTVPGIEYALFRYGILAHLRRLGYRDFRVTITPATAGQCVRLHGRSDELEHLLMECVLDRQRIGAREFLFINWLTLRNPRSRRAPAQPLLPGQEVPGLGLMREAAELLQTMARRLDLAGIAFCPAHYHLAAAGRNQLRFVDPARQGRFEALVRDLGHLPAIELSQALAQDRVLLDGVQYAWEATPMVHGLQLTEREAGIVAAERDRVRFCLRSAGTVASPGQPPGSPNDS